MSSLKDPGIGVVGLGFMGSTHIRAYQAAAAGGRPCHLVAVADPKPERRQGRGFQGGHPAPQGTLQEPLFDPQVVRGYARAEELFQDPAVDAVSITTPTPSHVDLALGALAAGKHVLLEKPVALHSATVQRLLEVARQSPLFCLPAMCMRFWPAWNWLLEAVADKPYGPVKSATFTRLGSRPRWSPHFYGDARQTGSALMDLHIHDADFICAAFGKPKAVMSAGSLEHLTTFYGFPDGPRQVVAEGGWDLDPALPFCMRYLVVFEEACASFDLGATPELRLGWGGRAEAIAYPPGNGYEGEVNHFLDLLSGRTKVPLVSLEDALTTTRLLETESRSLRRGVVMQVGWDRPLMSEP